MNYKTPLGKLVSTALADSFNFTFESDEVLRLFEAPRSSELGDVALPCFSFAKELKKAPPQIAQQLCQKIKELISADSQIADVKAVGPYLNFHLNKAKLAADLIPSILDESFIAPEQQNEEKVVVEYSQPNTHKAFHVGHVRNAALGDSAVRLLEWHGHEVIPVNYLGDEGTHVAKCLWYYERHFNGKTPDDNQGEFLGKLYSKATLMLDLSVFTQAPYPGVTAAKVKGIKAHPEQKEWSCVQLETLLGEKTVVTAASGFQVGDIVPYAKPGVRVSNRSVKALDKKGVFSEGMICSYDEIGLSEDNKVVTLPPETAIGEEVAELYRTNEGEAYASVLEELRKRQSEVGEVLSRIESREPETMKLWQKTKDWSMNDYYKIYDWLDCRFEHYFFESEFGEDGKKLARDYQKKGLFVESEGAIGADLEKYNLGFCILIKSDGNATYAVRDLVLAQKKFEEYGVDWSLYLVDAGQTFHFEQVFKILELMGYEQGKKCRHVPYGLVVLPEGKMSSRKGTVILFSELKRGLLQKIHAEFLDKYKDEWSADEIEKAGHAIALATMRYGMLNQDNNSNIIFDLNAWTEKSGNTGPYILYAYARISSILRDAGDLDFSKADYTLLEHETEKELISHLLTYRETLNNAVENFSLLLVCVYLFELAKRFSRMYSQCSVMNAESEELKVARASLIKAVSIVLKHGLSLLGIPTLSRM